MKLYVAFDVHSRSSVIAAVDEDGKRVAAGKVRNDPEAVVEMVNGLIGEVEGVVVESTYNWYWIVDALMDAGYRVHLANPSQVKKYEGLKHSDDRDDAFWLAEMLRLGVLPEGYIYPKQERPVRDLLRKRGHLVRLRTSLILSLESIITRNYGISTSAKDIRAVTEDRVTPLLEGNEDLLLAGRKSKAVIDFLTENITDIERVVRIRIQLRDQYKKLLTIMGVGQILAATIMLETGPISRFGRAGDYVSYCRKVPTEWSSDGKRKAKGNRKNGNKYLAWAWSEAGNAAIRHYQCVRRYYERKAQKSNQPVAHNAVDHKLARAGYYVMRDGVVFDPERVFGKLGRPTRRSVGVKPSVMIGSPPQL